MSSPPNRKRKPVSPHSPSNTSSFSSSTSSSSSSSSSSSCAMPPPSPSPVVSLSLTTAPVASSASIGSGSSAAWIPPPVQKISGHSTKANWSDNVEWEVALVQLAGIKYQRKIQSRKGFEMKALWPVILQELKKQFPTFPFTQAQIITKWKTLFRNYKEDVVRLAANPNLCPTSPYYDQLHPLWQEDHVVKNFKSMIESLLPSHKKKDQRNNEEKKESGSVSEQESADSEVKSVDPMEADESSNEDLEIRSRPPSCMSSSSADSHSLASRSAKRRRVSEKIFEALSTISGQSNTQLDLLKESVAVQKETLLYLKEKEKREQEKDSVELEIRKMLLRKMQREEREETAQREKVARSE